MKNLHFVILIILLVSLIYSCQSNIPRDENLGMPSDFTKFYTKFHIDSTYQMEHISFPLEGVPAFRMSKKDIDEDFKYQKADWVMHQPIIDSLISYQSLEMLSSNIVQEEIGIDNNGLMIFRRYSKIGNEWYLIYYMGPNFVRQ